MNQVFDPETQPMLHRLSEEVYRHILSINRQLVLLDEKGNIFGDNELRLCVNDAIKAFVSHPITAQTLIAEFLSQIKDLDARLYPIEWEIEAITLYDLAEWLACFPIVEAIESDSELVSKISTHNEQKYYEPSPSH